MIESLLKIAGMKLKVFKPENPFHICQVSFMVVKTAKCKRGIIAHM